MEIKSQTRVTEQNQKEFFANVYPQTTKSKSDLIQLDNYKVDSFIMADCCGWHYKTFWPDLTIIGLETLNTIKEYKLDRSRFQGMIDSRDYYNIKWPTVSANNSALVFDHSVILKYRTVDNVVDVITDAAETYQPQIIIFEASTLFIDDLRFDDRITSLSKILVPGYVVTSFVYDTMTLKISYKKKMCV